MGVRILHDTDDEYAAMYCSTTDWAFGPVFYQEENHDARERLEMFLDWLNIDPRKLEDKELSKKYSEWRGLEAKLWEEKELKELNDED